MNDRELASGEWVRVWTDAGAGQVTIRGGLPDDGMLLEGQIHDVSDGTTAPFRGFWTVLLTAGYANPSDNRTTARNLGTVVRSFHVRADGGSATR